MTLVVCSHHFKYAIWISINILLVTITILGGLSFASHDWKWPPLSLDTDKYVSWENGNMMFIFGIILLIVVNVAGIYFANERYQWFALKECPRD